MRDLSPGDIGVLLSFFAVLLLFFGIQFRISRGNSRHRERTRTFAVINLIGEAATVFALLTCWVALFMPNSERDLETLIVFIPGSISVACAVVLTVESVIARTVKALEDDPAPQ